MYRNKICAYNAHLPGLVPFCTLFKGKLMKIFCDAAISAYLDVKVF